MDMVKFGDLLSQYRKAKNMTQEIFASRMGVTSQAVSKWERGQSLPDISLLGDICVILDASANELIGVKPKAKIVESDDMTEQKLLLESLCAEPIKVIFGKNLIPAVKDGLKTGLIAEKRTILAKKYGILIPLIRMQDSANLHDNEYCFLSYDKILYRNELDAVKENTYANLIDELFHICLENYSEIINTHIVKTLIDNVKETYPGVADGLIPEKISYYFVQRVLAGILDKKIGIHNLIGIIEKLEEEVIIKGKQDINSITEEIIKIIDTKDMINSLSENRVNAY